MSKRSSVVFPLLLACVGLSASAAFAQNAKSNIVVIWGDDIGESNISAYNFGLMGYQTPDIDRLAKEGMMFTDMYADQSCTAGRSSFITGQSVVRTGLSKVGMPGAPTSSSGSYVYQVFWQAEKDPSRKATIFIGGTGGPDNPQFSNWNLFAAVEAFGPMASRPRDRMGVSGWVNGLSDNFRKDVSPVIDVRSTTWGFELYYNLEINKWLHLTPDLQLVQNQREANDIAVIPGVRLVIDF